MLTKSKARPYASKRDIINIWLAMTIKTEVKLYDFYNEVEWIRTHHNLDFDDANLNALWSTIAFSHAH
jgi:hypothetical protein